MSRTALKIKRYIVLLLTRQQSHTHLGKSLLVGEFTGLEITL